VCPSGWFAVENIDQTITNFMGEYKENVLIIFWEECAIAKHKNILG
jgi:hypothetical protein